MKSSEHLPLFPDPLRTLVLGSKFQTRKLTFSTNPGAHPRRVDEVPKFAHSKLWGTLGAEMDKVNEEQVRRSLW